MKNIFLFLALSLYSWVLFSQNSFVENNNQFSFKAYNLLKQTNNNFVFSPYSISSAVAMTYIGARNETKVEIQNTFGFSSDFNKLGNDYLKLNQGNLKSTNLSSANSLWLDNSLKLDSSFLKLNNQYFLTSVNQSNFLNNPDKSRIEINKWVENKTNNKIKGLLKPSTIDYTTRLVLVNAVHFKDSWENKFMKENNFKSSFSISKRRKVQAEYMSRSINTWHFSTKNYSIIDIPYKNRTYSLMIILPRSQRQLKKIEKNLDIKIYSSYLSNKELKRVKLSIPKFILESAYDLNESLIKLGMKGAFGSSADFSGITETEKLFISNVIHKANISIDEKGTEAAAATAVSMRKTSVLLDEETFNVDKPFIYIIRNTKNNCIYFMGKVTNPIE